MSAICGLTMVGDRPAGLKPPAQGSRCAARLGYYAQRLWRSDRTHLAKGGTTAVAGEETCELLDSIRVPVEL